MIKKLLVLSVLSGVIVFSLLTSLSSQPSFNGATPGCGPAGGCHTFEGGIISVAVVNNTQVQVTVSGNSGNVAGELVDSSGVVVAVNNGTGTNPFTLTAPHEGRFTVNAGFRNPTPRRWDSTQVVITLTGVGEDGNTRPGKYALEQNYPNPFNPGTTISYFLPERTHVTLKVYDVRGVEVATLVDGFEEPGSKSVRFDAENIATGTYLYRLQAGEYSETKHLVVMR